MHAKSVLGYLPCFINQQSCTVFSGACTSVPLHPSTAPSSPAEGTHRVEFCADAEHLDAVLSKIKDIPEISCLTTLPARYLLHSLILYSSCCLKQVVVIVFYYSNNFVPLCIAAVFFSNRTRNLRNNHPFLVNLCHAKW